LILLLFIPSLACGSFTRDTITGSSDIVNQVFDVRDFDRVSLEAMGSVFIEQGQNHSLSVQADDNIIPLLDIKVRGGELRLSVKPGYDINPSESMIFNVTVPELTAIAVDGSGDFHVGPVSTDRLAVSLRGSGNVEVEALTANSLSIDLDGSGDIRIQDVNVEAIETSLQGSGDIDLEGKAETEKLTVGGSGNYLAGGLEAAAADISIPGSAAVTLWVSDELQVRVNGSGDVQYYGQPIIDQSGSGSGNLTPLGNK
jgi:hypothetical protein